MATGWSKFGNVIAPSGLKTGAYYSGSGGGSTMPSWAAEYEGSSNPWEGALENAYAQVAKGSTGEGKYTGEWDSAIGQAKGLTGKDYSDELNRLAQEGIDKEKVTQGNQLGAIGMRELQFRGDVQDEWAKRRSDASTQAEIDAQGMQISALDALAQQIEGASGYELDQIAADLEQAKGLITAASAGAVTAQDWEQMVTDILSKYS